MLYKATILCRYRLLVDKVSSVLLPRSTLYTGKIAKHFYLIKVLYEHTRELNAEQATTFSPRHGNSFIVHRQGMS